MEESVSYKLEIEKMAQLLLRFDSAHSCPSNLSHLWQTQHLRSAHTWHYVIRTVIRAAHATSKSVSFPSFFFLPSPGASGREINLSERRLASLRRPETRKKKRQRERGDEIGGQKEGDDNCSDDVLVVVVVR